MKTSDHCAAQEPRLPKPWLVMLLAGFVVGGRLAAGAEPESTPAADAVADAEPAAVYLQLARDDDEAPRSLQTAIVRCQAPTRPRDGVTVDLVCAVHIGESSYYDQLNQRFAGYEVVLYEMILPEGLEVTDRVEGESGGHPITVMQTFMTRMLELEFQLDGIDYAAENLVHADMTAEQFRQTMQDRGESFLQIFFRMMKHAMAEQAESDGADDVRLLLAFFSKDRALALKRIMAEQFEDMEGAIEAIDGPDGSTIVAERNKVALDVLREQVNAGRKHVAIFYGAGHMPDFVERLEADFGLVPVETTWLDAWDLSGGEG